LTDARIPVLLNPGHRDNWLLY